MRKFTISATLLLTTALFASNATAQVATCPVEGPSEEVLSCLQEQFHEVPAHGGLTIPRGNLFQIFVNPGTGTFTVVESTATGFSKILGAGTDWFTLKPLPTKGKPA